MQILKLIERYKKLHKDYSLESGERQVANDLADIREDHLARYRLAINVTNELNYSWKNALDIFCGNGYGTYMLAMSNTNANVFGIDGSEEAISVANKAYKIKNSSFTYKKFPFKLTQNCYDFVTCFESLEHVLYDKKMFQTIVEATSKDAVIAISVPNNKYNNLELNPHKFHFRHYEHEDFISNYMSDFNILSWYGQNVYKFENGVNTFILLSNEEMQPVKYVEGQVNIYFIRRK